MAVGSLLGCVGVLWWSQAGSVVALYGAFAVMGLASAMVLYEPAFALVAVTVRPRARSSALLFITVVAGFAATIFLPLTNALVGWMGWRAALGVLALLVLATALPHALFLPGGAGHHRGPDGAGDAGAGGGTGTALRDPAFWWLTAAFVLGTASVTAVAAHMVAFLMDRGESAAFAAAAVGSLGAIKVGGRVVLALAERRAHLARLTALVFVSQGAALTTLAVTDGRAAILVFIAVYGVGFGAATIARPLLVAQTWGTASYGSIAGAVAVGVTVAKAVAPVAAGAARDALGSTTPVLLALGGITATAGLCLIPFHRRANAPRDPRNPPGPP